MAFTLLMDDWLMSSKFRTVDRDTLYLLPPSVQDWLPDDHLARFVVDIVERLDLSALERRYSGGGKDPYHPSLLLGLLFYGYAAGVFSSRKLFSGRGFRERRRGHQRGRRLPAGIRR